MFNQQGAGIFSHASLPCQNAADQPHKSGKMVWHIGVLGKAFIFLQRKFENDRYFQRCLNLERKRFLHTVGLSMAVSLLKRIGHFLVTCVYFVHIYKKDEMLLFYMKWNVGWSSVQYSHSKGWRTVLATHHDYFYFIFSVHCIEILSELFSLYCNSLIWLCNPKMPQGQNQIRKENSDHVMFFSPNVLIK